MDSNEWPEDGLLVPFPKLTIRSIFFLDGLGAFISALVMAFWIAENEPIFGFPRSVAYFLSFLAFSYALYSTTCFAVKPKNSNRFLTGIGIANFFYIGLGFFLIFQYWDRISFWGLVYFLLEKCIIFVLGIFEVHSANKNFRFRGD
jgi:hypothetical protein